MRMRALKKERSAAASKFKIMTLFRIPTLSRRLSSEPEQTRP